MKCAPCPVINNPSRLQMHLITGLELELYNAPPKKTTCLIPMETWKVRTIFLQNIAHSRVSFQKDKINSNN